jgi:nicotinamide-nucleotide amidase
MRLELITIGDELLLGYTVDTNAAFIARTLAEVGVEVVRRSTVGDDAHAIADAVRDALERTGAVITTGGLGPTADDRTRPTIGALFGRALRRDDTVLAAIEARFRAFGIHRPMPASNVVQAMVPAGARVLANHHGTAPGLWLEDERGRWVAMLPGVPSEMRAMIRETILPLIVERAGQAHTVVRSRTIRTTGIGESALAEYLGDLGGDTVNGLPLAYLPGWEGVDLRLTARDRSGEDAERALETAAAAVCARASRYVYGQDGVDLASVVLDLCRARSLRIGTAESCTGGLLGARLTAIPGASDVFMGGVVAYDNSVKTALLGVPEAVIYASGAVSEPVATLMARGACEAVGANVGIAITGIAGPDGGTPEKPVGTVWIAVMVKGITQVMGRTYLGDRTEVRQRAAQAALDLVRRTAGPAS